MENNNIFEYCTEYFKYSLPSSVKHRNWQAAENMQIK